MRKRKFGKVCAVLCLFAALSAESAGFAVMSEKNAEYAAVPEESTETASEKEEYAELEEEPEEQTELEVALEEGAETASEREEYAEFEAVPEEGTEIAAEPEEYGGLEAAPEEDEDTEKPAEPDKRPQADELSTAEIQQRLETDFGIGEVDLAGMEPETAREIYAAFSGMTERYPVLKGSLGSLRVGEVPAGTVAVTEYAEISAAAEGLYPIKMELRIVLGEREFLNPTRLENLIRKSVAEGHWMEGTKVETLLVHELAHVLVSRIRMERYGLTDFTCITEENASAFSSYHMDGLNWNQTTVREITENAYKSYRKERELSYEEACGSISGYASGEQEDGGISYEETIAEAVVDGYLHGEAAGGFSKEILNEIEKNWLFVPFPVSSVAKMKKIPNL